LANCVIFCDRKEPADKTIKNTSENLKDFSSIWG